MRDQDRFPSFDGLRGTAALMVMLQHLGTPLALGGGVLGTLLQWPWELGWAGVDLFFVLSGFLITGILTRRRDAENYFTAFYAHRALRVFPPLFLLLAIVTIMLPPLGLVKLNGPVWPYWFFLANMRFGNFVGDIDYLGVTWTLAIEEQFYIVWSVLVFYLPARRLAQVAAVTLLIGVMLRCSAVGVYPTNRIFSFTLTHLDGLCIGAVMRLTYDSPQWRPAFAWFARTLWFWALLYFAGIVADIQLGVTDHEWAYEFNMRFGLTLVSLFCGAAMARGILYDGVVRAIFDAPWLRQMGRYSYFMYLFHFLLTAPVGALVRLLGISTAGFSGLLILIAEFALVILAAHFSYRHFEAPLLRLKSAFPYLTDQRSALA